MFPVKSLGGMAVQEWPLEKRGLAYDRRWMLVDEEGLFLSQRELPELALLQAHVENGALCISDRRGKQPDLKLPLEEAQTGLPAEVQIWEDRVQALDTGLHASTWFSAALSISCRLVYMPGDSLRQVDPQYAAPGDITGFSDGFPYLIATESSLTDLNRRLEGRLIAEMLRFRPNLVIRGGMPWEEDTWERLQIGDAVFRTPKPCGRCQMVTVDPGTAETGKEPLATLAAFRKKGNKVLFGINACWDNPEETVLRVRIGDAVFANP